MLTKLLRNLSEFSTEWTPNRRLTRRCCAAGLLSLTCLLTTTCPVTTTESAATGHWQTCASSPNGLHTVTCGQRNGLAFCAIPPVDPKRAAKSKSLFVAAVPQFPLTDTFTLHSRPTATKTIYLDFTGHSTTGTPWNSGGNTIVTAPYHFSGGSGSTFTDPELTQIQEIWQRVAECFSPFDVDVTTDTRFDLPANFPDLINSGGADTRWGIRVTIGDSSPDPAPSAGGVAYLGSFIWGDGTPTFVFSSRLGNFGKYIADATVHEVGHTLGLIHDGRITPSEGYYYGHGTGVTAWAPHMGVGYDVNLVQWSKGEYISANNTEDDLAIIVDPVSNGWGGPNGFGYRPDDAADAFGTAAAIGGTAAGTVFNIVQKGIIERTTDTDWYRINAGAGVINLSAVGANDNTMLDIQLELRSATGGLIASNNPADQLTAALTQTVTAGTYYVRVDGVARTGTLPDEGYTEYGSLGQYRITGTCTVGSAPGGNVVASYNKNSKTLTLTGDKTANSVSVTYSTATSTITVLGLNGTKVNNKTTAQTYTHTGKLNLGAVMGDGNDSVYVIGVPASQLYANLGSGNDSMGIQMCLVDKLNVDGGIGTDTLVTTSSTIPPLPVPPAVNPNRIIKNVEVGTTK